MEKNQEIPRLIPSTKDLKQAFFPKFPKDVLLENLSDTFFKSFAWLFTLAIFAGFFEHSLYQLVSKRPARSLRKFHVTLAVILTCMNAYAGYLYYKAQDSLLTAVFLVYVQIFEILFTVLYAFGQGFILVIYGAPRFFSDRWYSH